VIVKTVSKLHLFDRLHEMLCSRTFTLYAANEMQRAYCMMSGFPYEPIDRMDKEKIAMSWAPIPAADAVVHMIAYSNSRGAPSQVLSRATQGGSESEVDMHSHSTWE